MRLWTFISVLALATGIGIFITKDPGYALFAYGDWAIEMPLWVSAILFIAAVTLTLVILNIINTIFFSSRQVRLWWGKHQELSARKKTHRGLIELAAGRWKNAEKYLIQSAAHSDTPLVNYLSAAKAAEEGDSPERRDRYLQLAFDVSAGSDVAVRLTQAQLQLEHGDLAQSIRNLERLREEAPKNPKVLRLLCTLYEAMNDWQSLHALLPLMQKTQALTPAVLEKLEQKVYPSLLPLFGEKGLKALMTFWQDSPSSIQSNPTAIAIYTKILVQKSAMAEAENLLRQSLKKCWNSQLVYLYGTLITGHPKTQLSFIESFFSNHADDPMLWLSTAKICLSHQLWGKARDYLEKSLALAPLPETYALLGQLMEQLNLREQSDQYYKQGLLVATQTSTELF